MPVLQDGGIPTAARDHWRCCGHWPGSIAIRGIPGNLLDWLGSAMPKSPVPTAQRGEQQRVKLAAAPIGRPELVFLDEPQHGLDPESGAACGH